MLTHQALTCDEKSYNKNNMKLFSYSKESAFDKAAHAMLGNLALELTAEVPLAPDVEVGARTLGKRSAKTKTRTCA